MPSSSKVIKGSNVAAVNLFKLSGLTDFSADSTRVQPALPVNESRQTENTATINNDFSSTITWSTKKVAGNIKESQHRSVRSWVVGDFQSESSNLPETRVEQPNASTVELEDYSYLIDEAKAKADAIVADAEKNADAILAQANSEAEAIKQKAFIEGMTAARNEMSQTIHQVTRIFQETQLWQEQVMRQSQSRIIEMVLSIGKKLFASGFELPAEQLDQIVSRAINEASRLGNLRVYLNPEDAKLLVNLWQESELTLNGQQIQIVSSQNISRGGCFIDGEFGVLDGRVEEQFDQINKSIKSAESNLEVE
ncbi:MAG: hypothetical protein GYA12_03995 [Chloroflexi bacterium]|nr:hypothetical protein [Chloroflexota bacterium]BCY17949.1 hypothetical protein hrd7_17980 [Leptolinea sp. HRD-7]